MPQVDKVAAIVGGNPLPAGAGQQAAAAAGPPRRRVLELVLALWTLRLLMGAALGVTFDEAYYLAWAWHPQLSYLDHPPLIAWLLYPVAAWSAPSPLLSRLPVMLLAVPFTWLGARLTLDVGGSDAARRSALLWMSLPVFVAPFFFVAPDAPLLASWMAAVVALRWALRTRSARAWLALGVALGACLLSKYMAFLFFPPLLVVVLTHHRSVLRTAGFWLAMMLAGAMFLPVLVWNARNDWSSFIFQLTMGPRHDVVMTGWRSALDAVVGQAAMVTPTALLGIVLACWAAARRLKDPDVALLFWFCVLPVVFLGAISWKHTIEANWMSIAWVTGVPLLAMAWPRLSTLSVGVGLGALVGLNIYAAHPFMPPGQDFTARSQGWAAVASAADACARDHGVETYAIMGDRRYETVLVPFQLGRDIPARELQPHPRYAYQPATSFADRDVVLLARPSDLHATYLSDAQRDLRLPILETCAPVDRRHATGETIETFNIYLLRRPPGG